MAHEFYVLVLSPLITFAYALRDTFRGLVDLVLAVWRDDRPVHTYGFASEVTVYAPQRARVAAFEGRRCDREPLRLSVGVGLRLGA